ncbi:NACHT, LRR and PYD domains-containing protein 3-like [Chanos chanos]|uniref:NACHT, LRR and PYD domains-containing protein 3-like n=1 Tax=Chanos chanos TaxID=29144 RepID=A0A6J2VKZ6_CHACN|nr:NACHT, LRR and PYD domains-containing protein 3-like [Chanos chanos]
MGIPIGFNEDDVTDKQGGCSVVHSKLKSCLREKFQRVAQGTARHANSAFLNDIYTELHIIDSRAAQINNEHEVQLLERGLKRVTTDDIPIKCNDVFMPLHGQDKPIRIVLTKGVAGIGKTVSVQKFILDWAEGEANQDIHFIFPLPFRELNLMKDHKGSLMDLLHFFFAETKALNSSEIENYKAVFIFDGLDECRLPLDFHNNKTLCDVTESASLDVLLTNLIKGNLLPSALIWITSRPAAASQIPPEYVSRVTEIRGFNDPQKEEYFRKRISDQSMASRIISHIKSLRSLFIMCHIPVFCWMSATVLERMLGESEGGKIPRTLTQMYTHFLLIQIKIIREKYRESKETDKDIIFKLGRLAFEQLEKGNLIFYEEDLRECGIEVREASVYSGVFTQIFREECGLYQRKVYCFVHLSIQEHLAALYVFLSFCNNNTNVLEHQPNSEDRNQNKTVKLSDLHKSAVDKARQSKTGHLDLFLRFLLGLSLESNQILLRDMLNHMSGFSQDREVTIKILKEEIKNVICPQMAINFFHCLNELNDNLLVEEVQSHLRPGGLELKKELTKEEWSALVFVSLTSEGELDVFDLREYGKSETVLFRILPIVGASTKSLLRECNLTWRGCAFLICTLSEVSSLRELDLSHNDLQDTGIKYLCSAQETPPYAGLKDPVCRLEALSLQNCAVTAEGCGYLASALRSNPSHLRMLDLSLNNLGDSGVKLLSAAIKDSHCKLEKLKLNHCNLTEESCVALSSAVVVNLKELSLNQNDLRDAGMKQLSDGLRDPRCKLQTLSLSNCIIRAEGCGTLASALRSNPSHLTELDLSSNELRDDGVELLCAALMRTRCKLQALKLNECGLTEKSCTALASLLCSKFSTLRDLDLSRNDLKDSGVIRLSAGLRSSRCKLETLSGILSPERHQSPLFNLCPTLQQPVMLGNERT